MSVNKWYHEATVKEIAEGLDWYPTAHNWCEHTASEYNVTFYQVAGIVAALSPRNYWDQNLTDARQVLELGADAKPRTFRANLEKALRILSCEGDYDSVLENLGSGPKVRAFYKCIVNPDDEHEVCVDSWAKRVHLDQPYSKKVQVRDKEYSEIAEEYRQVADQAGLLPQQVQAICWVAIRNVVYYPLWRV